MTLSKFKHLPPTVRAITSCVLYGIPDHKYVLDIEAVPEDTVYHHKDKCYYTYSALADQLITKAFFKKKMEYRNK